MLNSLPPLFRGGLTFCLLFLSSVFWCLPFFPGALIKLPPHAAWRTRCTALLRRLGDGWVASANLIVRRVLPTEWDIEAPTDLSRQESYLLLANHQSWVDIFVLLRIFGRRIPFPVFFVKKELLWMPFIGVAMWALDFPFVERYPREVVERRPQLRGRDLETSRRACERYRELPVTLVNFAEGTRFTREKYHRQGSPFRHLLQPRPGGVGVVLTTLGERLAAILDVTIVYPEGAPRFRDFLAGRVPRVIARVRRLEVPAELANGDYQGDVGFRNLHRVWLEDIWAAKDRRIDDLLREAGADT